MPTWRTELPPEGANRGYDLHRTPTNGSLIAIVTCDDLLVCDTHYWHGRTTPCERLCNAEGRTIDDSKCPACLDKQGWRSHVYVSAYDAKKRDHFIFECTTHAAKPLEEYRDAAGKLRGCILNASRAKGTPNGKVSIITHPADITKSWLPQPPDVVAALAVIWRLPRTALTQQDEKIDGMPHAERKAPAASHIRPRSRALTAMRNQPDNAGTEQTIGEIIAGNGELQQRTNIL